MMLIRRLLVLALLLAASTAGAAVQVTVGAGDCRPQAVGALTYGAAPTCLTATATPTSTATPTATSTPTPSPSAIPLPLSVTNGGTHANLSGTGGTSQFLKQGSTGADITVVRPACSDLSDASATCATAGATRALDNLASVAINSALLPSAAAGLDFGSATLPWKDLWLAGGSSTPGTNNFKITGTSTSGTRVFNVVDSANSYSAQAKAAVSHQFFTAFSTAGAFTQAQPAVADLSDGSTGSGSVVLGTSPTIATPLVTGDATFGTAAAAANAVDINETAGCITFEGSTADANEARFCVVDPTVGDATFNVPNRGSAGTSTFAMLEHNQTFTGIQSFNTNNPIFNAGPVISNGQGVNMGPNGANGYVFSGTTNTPDSPQLLTNVTANSWHLYEVGDVGFDFNNGPCGTSACTDPTFIVHSHNQNTAQWVGMWHDGTDGHLDTGLGGLLGLRRAVESVTTTKTPTATGQSGECNELYISGDVDGQTITLPNDPTIAGCTFTVVVDRAQTSNNTALAPGSGESLIYAGSSYTTSCTATAIGSSITVVNVGTGSGAKWAVIAAIGTWTCS
jgi:hypothetical protein